jgi:hypothetical protein
MLVIRAAQMAVFAKRAWDDFLGTATEALLDAHAGHMDGVSPQARVGRVRWSLEQARARGLQDGDNLIQYASCLLAYGPGFAAHPPVAQALRAHGEADEHWRRLFPGMPGHVWRELDLLYADEDWLAVDDPRAAGMRHAE